MSSAALFLDRDGTLIEDRGHLGSISEVFFFPDTVAALRRLQAAFRLFIVTHQPGIALGLVSASDVERVNAHVVAALRRSGVDVTEVYCCPHQRGDGCGCIKPQPYFLHQAAARYDLDLSRCYVIGDHPHDVRLGENAGATGLYVLTGHGVRHRGELPSGAPVAAGIHEAADWILAHGDMVDRERRDPGRLSRAAACLRGGGLVAFPTETVYGLGADAFNEAAVARIFEAKQRPRFDPLIVHISDLPMLSELVATLPDPAMALIDRFWPGPLTLVLPRTPRVPDLVTSGLPTVAVRMPAHPMAQTLIRMTGTPLAAPSANPFGQTSPTSAEHVRATLRDKADLVLDGGAASIGVESTILSLAGDRPCLLRPGGLALEALEALIGPIARIPSPGVGAAPAVMAPGMLPRHYAPRTPLHWLDPSTVPGFAGSGMRWGALVFCGIDRPERFAALETLSPGGDLREAAANLFGALRRLDGLELDGILAERVPDRGLGLAINDRLARAATS